MECKQNSGHSKQPSWHTLENVGMMAVNDSRILRACTYNIVQFYFSDTPDIYNKLEDLRRTACDKYHLGRGLYEKLKKDENLLDTLTEDVYRQVINFMVGYSSYFIPVMMAFNLTETSLDSKNKALLKEILLDTGYYQQIHQDYNKLFNKPDAFEMSEGDLKLNWFFVKTIDQCRENGTQNWNLLDYAEDLNVDKLKQIYKEHGLLQTFISKKNSFHSEISQKIDTFQHNSEIAPSFINLLKLLISK